MSSTRIFPLLPIAVPHTARTPHGLTQAAMTFIGWVRAERIGRRRYVFINVISGLIGFSIIFVPYLLFLFLPDIDLAIVTIPFTMLSVIAVIGMLVIFLSTSISRLRDMGVSRNWFVAGLIPYLNIIFFVVLALSEGKKARINWKAVYGRKMEKIKTL